MLDATASLAMDASAVKFESFHSIFWLFIIVKLHQICEVNALPLALNILQITYKYMLVYKL